MHIPVAVQHTITHGQDVMTHQDYVCNLIFLSLEVMIHAWSIILNWVYFICLWLFSVLCHHMWKSGKNYPHLRNLSGL